jgi:hypothetical protein
MVFTSGDFQAFLHKFNHRGRSRSGIPAASGSAASNSPAAGAASSSGRPNTLAVAAAAAAAATTEESTTTTTTTAAAAAATTDGGTVVFEEDGPPGGETPAAAAPASSAGEIMTRNEGCEEEMRLGEEEEEDAGTGASTDHARGHVPTSSRQPNPGAAPLVQQQLTGGESHPLDDDEVDDMRRHGEAANFGDAGSESSVPPTQFDSNNDNSDDNRDDGSKKERGDGFHRDARAGARKHASSASFRVTEARDREEGRSNPRAGKVDDAHREQHGGSAPDASPESRRAHTSPGANESTPEKWPCPRCTLANPIRSRRCAACHERRPVGHDGVDKETPAPSHGRSPPSSSRASPSAESDTTSSSANARKRKLLSPPRSPAGLEAQQGAAAPARTQPSRRRKSSSISSSRSKRPSRSAKQQDASEEPPTDGTSPTMDTERHGSDRMDGISSDIVAPVPIHEGTEAANDSGIGADAGLDPLSSRRSSIGAAVRVSTSPFVPVLPIPVPNAARNAEATNGKPKEGSIASMTSPTNIHSSPPKDSSPTANAPDSESVESMLKVVRGRFEMQNQWYRERVLEGRRLVQLRRNDLDRAESELRRAEADWRAFQLDYDAFRNQQPASTAAATTDAAATLSPASSARTSVPPTRRMENTAERRRDNAAFHTPMLRSSNADKAAATIASSLASGSSHDDTPFLSPSLLCREIHAGGRLTSHPPSPADDASLLRRRSPPARDSTNEVLRTSVPSSDVATAQSTAAVRHSVPPPLGQSLSQTSVPPSQSPVIDSQATIDPDLDSQFARSMNRRDSRPARNKVTFSDPSSTAGPHGTRASIGSSSGEENAPQPTTSSLRKQPPLSVSTNKARPAPSSTWSGVWDSTKSSRDFVAPRSSKPGNVSATAQAAAAAATGEWIQAAKRARQSQRDRSKPREALWDEDDDDASQPPRQDEPNYPYQEVVRCKALREQLPCHDCYSCRAFYAALPPEDALLLLQHSRHRAQHSPSETPQDFWVSDFIDEVEKEREEAAALAAQAQRARDKE